MKHHKRYRFKFLGNAMEIVNVTPKEFRRILWHIALIVLVSIATWRAPEIIRAIALFNHGS